MNTLPRFSPAPPPASVLPTSMPVKFMRVAEAVPPLPAPNDTTQQGFFDSLRAVTPALIITGIAIGIASGIGTTVGATIGSVITDRFRARPRASKRSR